MTLPELLKKTVEIEGSDLHITINTPPQVRVHGHLQRVEGADLTTRPVLHEELLVRLDRMRIGSRRIMVPPGTKVNVGRHMN